MGTAPIGTDAHRMDTHGNTSSTDPYGDNGSHSLHVAYLAAYYSRLEDEAIERMRDAQRARAALRRSHDEPTQWGHRD